MACDLFMVISFEKLFCIKLWLLRDSKLIKKNEILYEKKKQNYTQYMYIVHIKYTVTAFKKRKVSELMHFNETGFKVAVEKCTLIPRGQ